MKLRVFVALLLCAGGFGAARGQAVPQSAPAQPAGTNTFQYYAARKLERELAMSDDSAARERVQKLHARWLAFWGPRASPDTDGSGFFAPLSWSVDQALRQPPPCQAGSYKGNWRFLGPDTDFFGKSQDKSGRLWCIWASPSQPDSILAGAASGGLWRSIDGGRHWANITDRPQSPQLPGTMGVRQVLVNPQDHRNIYLATGTENGREDYTLGVVYTTDGGQNWQIDYSFRDAAGTTNIGGIGLITPGEMILRMARSPLSGRIYALMPHRILMMPSFGSAWQNITPPAVTALPSKNMLYDMEFAKDGSGKIFFSTSNTYTDTLINTQYLFTYQEGGGQWAQYPLTFPTDTIHPFAWLHDMTQATDGTLYYSTKYNNGCRLYSSNATGGNLTLRNALLGDDAREVIASGQYAQVLYLLNVDGRTFGIHKSTNGGLSWSQIGNTHADTRSLQIWRESSTATASDEVLFSSTDGGVSVKKATDAGFTSITGQGLYVTQFLGLSQSDTRGGMLTAGAIDNGSHAYHAAAPTPWSIPGGGDGLLSAFGRNGLNQAYIQSNGGMGPRLVFNAASIGTGSSPGDAPDYIYGQRWLRRLWLDAQNTLYSGRFFIYKKESTGWKPGFGPSNDLMGEPKTGILNQPAYAASIQEHKNVVSCLVSESDPNIAYIAYEKFFENAAEFVIENKQNLFVTKEATEKPAPWKNISIPLTGIPVTDIAIDPQRANRIWACYGGVIKDEILLPASSRTKRVYYSDNYGASWTDVSKGLPMVPLLKLLYVAGTDDVLFAGTEVGVYRWNKAAGEWQCFNNGMPVCNITGLDMNYCNGLLRVSTFGRGIWETEINADAGQVTPGYAHTITGDENWTGSRTVNGSISVQPGAHLTISGGTVYMPRNGRIVVEPGGRLTIDGATLTNLCGSWNGIEVAGRNDRPADPAYQGLLELRNGAVLEHARTAIRNYSDRVGRPVPGGLIVAEYSTIRNCNQAVSLLNTPAYSYYYNNGAGSWCRFEGMQFELDDAAYAVAPVTEGYFNARNIKSGIELLGSTFRCSADEVLLPYARRLTAVQLQGAGARVQGCRISGFRQGLYTSGWTGAADRLTELRSNILAFNGGNITVGGDVCAQVQGNSITDLVPYTTVSGFGLVTSPWGIYLDGSRGAYVGCSNFVDGSRGQTPFPGTARIGILCRNTGASNANLVVNNTLTQLDRGLQTQQSNPDLQVSCNHFEHNVYALAVNPQSSQPAYLLANQGNGCGAGYTQADNQFTSNQADIVSWLSNPWHYFAGNGTGQMPVYWAGTVNLHAGCGPANDGSCKRFLNCEAAGDPGARFSTDLLYTRIGQYRKLADQGLRYELEAQQLFTGILQGFHYTGQPGLTEFLEGEKDERASRLLLPLYAEAGRRTDLKMAIDLLKVSGEEKTAYNRYYSLLADVAAEKRTFEELRKDEQQALQELAAATWEVSPFAGAWLEACYGQPWLHPVEDLPLSPKSGKVLVPASEQFPLSSLGDAVPNPARQLTVIRYVLSAADAQGQPRLVLRNAAGGLMGQYALGAGAGEVSIGLDGWAPGLYFYSLYANGRLVETRKLSVAK